MSVTLRNILVVILPLGVFLATSCKLAGPSDTAENSTLVIQNTVSFGECFGYCNTILTIQGDSLTLVRIGRNIGDKTFPDLLFTAVLDEAKRTKLAALASLRNVAMLDDVYGCPDCTDGGAEEISVSQGDEHKTITFPYHEAPDALNDLAILLADIRHSFDPAFP